MKVIIGETESLRSFALIIKSKTFEEWSAGLEKFIESNKIKPQSELRILESLASRLGMNVKKFDRLPYIEFLKAIHNQLQSVKSITVNTGEGYSLFHVQLNTNV